MEDIEVVSVDDGMDGFQLHTVLGEQVHCSLDEDKVLVEIYSQTNSHICFSREELVMLIDLFKEILEYEPPLRN